MAFHLAICHVARTCSLRKPRGTRGEDVLANDAATTKNYGHCGNGPSEAMEAARSALEELTSMGFEACEATEALETCQDDLVEALAFLSQRHKKRRVEGGQKPALETLEVEGIKCSVTAEGELVMLLPGDELRGGPVIGHRKADGSLLFEGMDDWLWELYEGHRPREELEGDLHFDPAAVRAALEEGAPYVWDGFASAAEIQQAHAALEEMFQRGQLSRGSGLWVDECNEGGHARNRKALEGQQRDDACGFWDVQGGAPAPPAPVLKLFHRLEVAAARLRSSFGWPLLCSRLGMAAVYDGQGACYEQHRDNEWQRHLRSRTPQGLLPKTAAEAQQRRLELGESGGAPMNFRELTMLAYVNMPEDFGDHAVGRANGGRLRCYVATKRGDLRGDTAQQLQDLEPLGGRAVIFRSKDLLHEVLPSFCRRYCLTFWVCTPH
ncbi:unnamed protein product [Durusdinium trenchii]|uniref:UBA domain-containing protein n=1 Tax=Durusdinium trenchii TaxID=1381693 RepID=A0ABP0I5R5_9DINO